MKDVKKWVDHFLISAEYYKHRIRMHLLPLRRWLRKRFFKPIVEPHTIIFDDTKCPVSNKKILILFFKKSFWNSQPIETFIKYSDIPDDCEISTDLARLQEASAVVFHVPELTTLKGIPRFPGQLWVGWSGECMVHRPYQNFHDQFDLTMTYKTDADIFNPYLPSIAELRQPPKPKLSGKLISFFASNWTEYSGRSAYAFELMKYLQVDSFGKCLNNKKIINDSGKRSKLGLMSTYRFNLAFENAIDLDYVTEKIYDPLIAGTVPVYLGAPNIEDFSPGDQCYIDCRNFQGPKEMADYLLYLDQNEEAYAQNLTWKGKPFRQKFQKLSESVKQDYFTRLFLKISEHFQTAETK